MLSFSCKGLDNRIRAIPVKFCRTKSFAPPQIHYHHHRPWRPPLTTIDHHWPPLPSAPSEPSSWSSSSSFTLTFTAKVRPDYGLGWMKEGKCAETIGAGAATEPDLVASCIGYRIYYDEFPKGWSCFSSEGCFLKKKQIKRPVTSMFKWPPDPGFCRPLFSSWRGGWLASCWCREEVYLPIS